MYEVMTKTRFTHVLIREHVGVHELRKSPDHASVTVDLRLDVEAMRGKPYRLVIRSARLGAQPKMLKKEFPHTLNGLGELHKVATEIAIAAATKASQIVGDHVEIELPVVRVFEPWFQTDCAGK
jgi:hypothetical protein